MRDYDDLREMLCKELDDLYDETAKKGGVNAADLDAIRDITSAIKNTYKIEMFEGGDYSRDGDWGASIRGTYSRGNSYARRGTHYVRGHYSRGNSQERMRMQLEDMMREADTDAARDAIRRCMDALGD